MGTEGIKGKINSIRITQIYELAKLGVEVVIDGAETKRIDFERNAVWIKESDNYKKLEFNESEYNPYKIQEIIDEIKNAPEGAGTPL